MRKRIIVLLLAMIPAIYAIGQDLKNDFIKVNKDIQSRAEKVLLENELLTEYKLQNLNLHTARETSSGYNFTFKHYTNNFLVEGDDVKLMLDFDFNLRWSDVNFSSTKISDFSTSSEKEAIEKVKNHEYLSEPELLKVEKVIARLGDNESYGKYYRIDLNDSKKRLQLKYYVSMRDGSIAGIYDLFTSEVYVKGKKGKKEESSSSRSVCCNNAGENGRYHIVDPITTSSCSDIDLDFHSVGNDFLLGLSNDVVTFSNDPTPVANDDGIFCYDFDTNDYNILHSYIYTKELLASSIGNSPSTVILDVDGNSNAFVSTDISNNKITFGSNATFNDMAADRFHVAHGFFQLVAKNRVGGLNISNTNGTGSIDYLVMNHYNQNGVCYAYGGTQSIGSRRTNHVLYTDAISETAIQNTNEIQAWSSYLMRIDVGLPPTNGVGGSDTDNLLFDIIDMLGNLSIAESVNLLFATAKTATYIDNEELCRIYRITNDYMNGVSGFSITLDDLPDYYIKDSSVDQGNEPYWYSQMWTSPSIWNTVGSPNGTIGNPETGSTNYLHVLVEDKNGIPATDKFLHVYFSMASLGLSWPDDWMNNVINGQQVSGELTPQAITSPGEYIFAWNPPDPSALSINDKHHVCIYARITDENNTVRNSNCDLEGSGVGSNTNRFNSIAWKNLSIIDTNGLVGGGGNTGEIKEERVSVFVRNPNPREWYDGDEIPEEIDLFTIEIRINPTPQNPNILPLGHPDQNFFEECDLFLEFDPKFGLPTGGEFIGDGFKEGKEGKIQITSPDFKIEKVKLEKKENYLLTTTYKPTTAKPKPISFSWVLKNYKGKIVGGELYQSGPTKKTGSWEDEINFADHTEIMTRSMKDEIRVVPNPTSGEANILSSKEISSIDIIDMNGSLIDKVLFSKKEVDNYSVNLQDQLSGVYTLRISYRDGTMESVNLIKK